MTFLLFLGMAIFLQDYQTNGCLPRKRKELTDSYTPVSIQVLSHYKAQLQIFYPYIFTGLCKTGKQEMAVPEFPPEADVCVAETLTRINLFLIDLQRDAAKQNLEDSQGEVEEMDDDDDDDDAEAVDIQPEEKMEY